MKQKIQSLLSQLNHGLVERTEVIKPALLAVLAGENPVLVGPPGTGKSLIARRLADSLGAKNGAGHFEYLLTKFSTPEEIFGPLSIAALKADRFHRNTAGYLPAVKTAFLDEIFKASSSILNSLLTILNERLYHNGAERQNVPLHALIAASNELPTEKEELNALYDRFLTRVFVDYVSQDGLPRLFESVEDVREPIMLAGDDLDQIRIAARSVRIPPQIVDVVQRIWIQHKEAFKEDRREGLSDRRLTKVIHLLRVSAATNDRDEVNLSDLVLLKDCLWNHQDNVVKVRDLIFGCVRAYSRLVPQPDLAHKANTAPPMPTPHKGGQARVGGFAGAGTEDDPLLVESYEHLMDLCRLEVGGAGLYFRQTGDIDCSSLSTWPDTAFKGYYDGGGYVIRHAARSHLNFFSHRQLFKSLEAGSSIVNLNLENLTLADVIVDSSIVNCHTTEDLVATKVEGSVIRNCMVQGHLVKGSAVRCEISCCASGQVLIFNIANRCTIKDCMVVMDFYGDKDDHRGGIASLAAACLIENCFVTGKCGYTGSGLFYLSGVATTCKSTVISGCALGTVERSERDVRLFGIVENLAGQSQLTNNAAISTNKLGSDEVDGPSGRCVAAERFNQRYFEHTLGWDFEYVWEWDAQENRPALCASPGQSVLRTGRPARHEVDLLTLQIRENIWL